MIVYVPYVPIVPHIPSSGRGDIVFPCVLLVVAAVCFMYAMIILYKNK